MSKTYYYLRISTITQKFHRQELKVPAGETPFKDICSGSIAWLDRPAAAELTKFVQKGDTIIVQHLDRLGRNTADMFQTLEMFFKMGVNIRIAALKIESLNDDGTENLSFKLISGILSVLSEFEKVQIAERRDAGIQSAKDRKVYKGRPSNTEEKPAVFLDKHKLTVKALKENPTLSLRKIIKLATKGDYQPSPSTVQKVKDTLAQSGTIQYAKKAEE